jgi:hypothetical protein
MQIRWLLLSVAVCMLGCSGDAVPVAPTDVVAPEGVAESSGGVEASGGNSACYAVKFNVGGLIPPFQVTGDLVGTRQDSFDIPGSLRYAGVTTRFTGTSHWHITAGVVPGLEDFETSYENKNLDVDRPGSPADVFENIGTHRALEGVQKANLTYRGTASPAGLDHDFTGVICP